VSHEDQKQKGGNCKKTGSGLERFAAPDLAAILGPRAGAITAAARGSAHTGQAGGTSVAALVELAGQGRFLVKRPDRKPDKYGAEHDVYLSANGRRVFKFARNYGFTPRVHEGQLIMAEGTPDEYLLRMALLEKLLPMRARIEGLTDDGTFVLSQLAIPGHHPTEHEMRRFMLDLGFINLPARFGQGGCAWYLPLDEILVMDASPDNFVKSPNGIIAIDLHASLFDEAMRQMVAVAESLRKHAPIIPS
jgi:hypothetical protein